MALKVEGVMDSSMHVEKALSRAGADLNRCIFHSRRRTIPSPAKNPRDFDLHHRRKKTDRGKGSRNPMVSA
jgi:hypothetical protein